MFDPKDIESVVDRSYIVIECLSKYGITFKIPLVRCRVAALGYQFIWNNLDRETLTKNIMDVGFDNLTTLEIVNILVRLSYRMNNPPKRSASSLPKRGRILTRVQWEEYIKAKVKAGKF